MNSNDNTNKIEIYELKKWVYLVIINIDGEYRRIIKKIKKVVD